MLNHSSSQVEFAIVQCWVKCRTQLYAKIRN